MASKDCCPSENSENGVIVRVNVDVPKIIKYLCITGIIIVGIIFGTKTFKHMLEHGFFEIVE
ncbi:MAG TPA: hypothetical protein GXX75_26300 [Clostridiales bacterium]|nr:hypothetical protein [Clostridiales bacterium]